MGGWLKLFVVLLAIGTGIYRWQDHGSLSLRAGSSTAETSAEAAAVQTSMQAVATRVSGPNKADADYLQNYMMTVQKSDHAYPFGTTVQNVSLPSGHAAQVTIQKNKTGWCPLRHEPTYSVSIGVTVK